MPCSLPALILKSNLCFALRREKGKQRESDKKLKSGTLMKKLPVPFSNIMANTFMFRDPDQEIPGAFSASGVRQGPYSLEAIMSENFSRACTQRAEADPIIKHLVKTYWDDFDAARANGTSTNLVVSAEEMIRVTAVVGAQELARFFEGGDQPVKDGPETDKIYITTALRYIDPEGHNVDKPGMFTRPGACK